MATGVIDSSSSSSPFALHSRLSHRTPPIKPGKLLLLQTPQSNIPLKKPLDIAQLQEGLQSVTSSLSLLSETIGNALAESFTVIESRSVQCSESPQSSSHLGRQPRLASEAVPRSCDGDGFQGQAPRSSMDKGVAPDEEDLVRRQLETLLAEKARLVQENATYKRENQFLHEAVEYHRLTVQGMVVPDDIRMPSNRGVIAGIESNSCLGWLKSPEPPASVSVIFCISW